MRFLAFLSLRTVAMVMSASILGSCSSSSNSPASPTPTRAATEPNPFARIKKGMTAAEVREILGAPASVEPGPNQELKSEIWVYNRPVQSTTTQAATTVRQVDAVDPISGQNITVPEPVYQTVVVRISETAQLLMIDGKLIEWKTTREAFRNY